MTCYCHQSSAFEGCCQPLLSGQTVAASPKELLRSRYTAFRLNDIAYLKKTWHPDTCPEDLSEGEPQGWIKLEILSEETEGDEAYLEFKAYLVYQDKLEILHEKSQFIKSNDLWLYHSGDFLNDGDHISRVRMGDLCPCGSGKKFKRCHFK